MLTSMLLALGYWLIEAVVFALDKIGSAMPDQLNSVVQQLIAAIYVFDFIFPVDTLFIVLTYMITFELAMLTKTIVVSIVNWVRGAGELKV